MAPICSFKNDMLACMCVLCVCVCVFVSVCVSVPKCVSEPECVHVCCVGGSENDCAIRVCLHKRQASQRFIHLASK